MARRQSWRLVCCAIGIALATVTASALEAAAEPIVAFYRAYWAGLPAARIRVELRDGGPGYHDEIAIDTEGLPHLFTRFRATATAEGHLAADRRAEPLRYLAVYDLRKRRDRRVSMQFIGRGGAAVAERGPDDTSGKPPLAEMFRKNAVDPLSALERLRQALRAPSADRSFIIPVYDGARRFDIAGRILADTSRADGIRRAELVLRPIAGFKGETSEDGDPDNAPRKVELTVTDDPRTMPLSITVPLFFMPLVIQFERFCVAPERCSG